MNLKYRKIQEDVIDAVEPEEDLEPEEMPESDDADLFDQNFDDPFGDDAFGSDQQAPLQKYSDLLKELTNFAPYLKTVFNNWLGLSWDEEQGKYVRNKLIRPIMNLQGASWCASRLLTYARSNNIITDISYDDYLYLQEDMITEYYLNVGTKAEDFGVTNEGDIIRVCHELLHGSILVLMGAGDGKYTKFLGTTVSRHENVRPMPEGYALPYPQPGMSRPARTGGALQKMKRLLGIG